MKSNMIEEYISPLKNDTFSSLRGLDLQALIVGIENFYLTYRSSLGLPPEVTFGTEIEYEDAHPSLVDSYIEKNLRNWRNGIDGSLSTIGGEITSPVMCDSKAYWEELKRICHFLNFLNANTYKNAGGHVHVGAHILGNDIEAWEIFLKLYACYENVLYRFGFGDKATPRKKIEEYAFLIASDILKLLNSPEKLEAGNNSNDRLKILLEQLVNFERYGGINFDNVWTDDPENNQGKNTLEFRFPNATIEEVVWQNNINTFAKMMLACRNRTVDTDFLAYRLKQFEINNINLSYYSAVDLKKALEFVDLVFDKNIDKIYFLRQYIKGFYTSTSLDKTVKAKRFIK